MTSDVGTVNRIAQAICAHHGHATAGNFPVCQSGTLSAEAALAVITTDLGVLTAPATGTGPASTGYRIGWDAAVAAVLHHLGADHD